MGSETRSNKICETESSPPTSSNTLSEMVGFISAFLSCFGSFEIIPEMVIFDGKKYDENNAI